MQLVETAVEANLNMLVSAGLTIIAQLPSPHRNLGVGRQYNTAVAHRTQVLGGSTGSSRQPSRQAQFAGHPSSPQPIERSLRPPQRQARSVLSTRSIKGMAIEVNRPQRQIRLVRCNGVDRRVQIQSPGLVDIAPHWYGSGAQNRKRRCERG